MYTRLTGGLKFKVFHVFCVWFAIEYPHLVKKGLSEEEKNLAASGASKRVFAQIVRNPSLLHMKDLV